MIGLKANWHFLIFLKRCDRCSDENQIMCKTLVSEWYKRFPLQCNLLHFILRQWLEMNTTKNTFSKIYREYKCYLYTLWSYLVILFSLSLEINIFIIFSSVVSLFDLTLLFLWSKFLTPPNSFSKSLILAVGISDKLCYLLLLPNRVPD